MESIVFLTNDEMSLIRAAVETQAGFDADLINRCSHLIHVQAFDEAVHNAFVLLEERMRKILQKEGVTGYNMAQFAFSTNGPFTKMLSHNQHEYEGTRDLFYGAFRLYRNPAAHTIVGYSGAETRSILSLVNLLLGILDRLSLTPQPGAFPPNIETVLTTLEQQIGIPATNKVRTFLGQSIKLNMHPSGEAKQWIPFRKYAYVKSGQSTTTKKQLVTVFYLTTSAREQGIWFPIRQYHTQIVGFNKEEILARLQSLGFIPIGKIQDPAISLNTHHTPAFLNEVLATIVKIGQEFDKSLVHQG